MTQTENKLKQECTYTILNCMPDISSLAAKQAVHGGSCGDSQFSWWGFVGPPHQKV